MSPRVGVVQFPGTNCELDAMEAFSALGARCQLVWHADSIGEVDAVVLPGGFAHGDYLRTGAIARFSPVMESIAEFARRGGPVLGICNGFQILCEAQLLPGALQRNVGLKFICATTAVRVETAASAMTAAAVPGSTLQIPINHFEGNYVCDDSTYAQLVAEDRIVLRYVDNPNGSRGDIAGICSAGRNVVGLMPHPERACDPLLGSADGAVLIRSVLEYAREFIGAHA